MKHKTHQKHTSNIKEAEAVAEGGVAKDFSDSIPLNSVSL